MANIKHFADTADRGTLQFQHVDYRRDGVFGFDHETNAWIKCTRKVEYKSFPSKHTCDSRCLYATGKVMKCECSCGGKNHGAGRYFTVTREVSSVAF